MGGTAGEGGKSGAAGNSTAAFDACALAIKARIARAKECGWALGSGTGTGLVTPAEIDTTCKQVQAWVTTGKMALKQSALADCIARLQAIPCDDNLAVTVAPRLCRDLFPGNLDEGAACDFPLQCKQGLGCTSITCGPGTCVPEPKVGDNCVEGACGAGAACSPAQICVTPLSAGKKCAFPNDVIEPCAKELFCDVKGTGTCRPYAHLGDTVASPTECLSQLWDLKTKKCAAAPTLGASCLPEQCGWPLDCDPSTKTCVPLGELGKPCSPEHQYCAAGFCTNGLCVPRVPVGQACDHDLQNCEFGASCVVEGSGAMGVCQAWKCWSSILQPG